jgi:SsrA-binding protein
MAGKKANSARAVNRRARHEYEILERYEAGLVLTGSEVKSLREGRVSLTEGYAKPRGEELYLHGVHIAEYANAGYASHEPTRPRKLLLHRREIGKIIPKVSETGLTLVPLALYFKRGYAKVELGLGRGKKLYDKRRAMKERDAKREIQRQLSAKRAK